MKYELHMIMNTKMHKYKHQRFEELLLTFCNDFKNLGVSKPRKLAYWIDGQDECIDYIYELDVKAIDGNYRTSAVAIESLCEINGDCLRYLLVKKGATDE